MSTSQSVEVSTGDLGRLANELRSSATVVAGHAGKINDSLFGEAHAGDEYAPQGKQIQAGLEKLRQRIDDWSTAADAVADAINVAGSTYSTVDEERANQMNNQ